MAKAVTKPIRIYANLKGKPEQIFDSWLDPKKITKWMTASSDDRCLKANAKPIAGSHFSFVNIRDGKEIIHYGEYIEIRRPHRLVFTWGIEGIFMGASRVAIDFEPNGDETLLTLTHRGFAPEERERTEGAWKRILVALEAAV